MGMTTPPPPRSRTIRGEVTTPKERRNRKEFPPPEHAWKVWIIALIGTIIIYQFI